MEQNDSHKIETNLSDLESRVDNNTNEILTLKSKIDDLNLDYDKYLEEAGTMNIFVRIADTLITSPTNDRILDGITRKSALKVAEEMGINVEIRSISIDEVIEASNNGELKEIFGAGTAVVIIPITGFGYKNTDYKLPNIKNSYASRLKKVIIEIQYNISEDPYGWRIEV